ncbi:SymE family type I addiction module toxin [Sporomusa termitida]|uniref:Toxin SymE-like domain-containing protein n=1 Tax=Sporomusa termitida TaxID=2377 RepID=A0A517DVH7_9FIRM|nr:SymE family type I addiction module toxin [Sporomusa termitida]QDR81327.1 hypothetical protein SPTER_27050 [Sporomusa termitida]
MGKRILKIYSSAAYSKLNVPCIILQGKWLQGLGFKTGNHVAVEEGEGELVIRLVQKENI